MALGPESSPRLLEPIVVLKLVNVTWLSALTAVNWRSALRRSPIRKTRLMEPRRLNCIGPGMVSRPALPLGPARGAAKAAKLTGSPAGASVTERPVALARTLPVMPVPVVVERLPPTIGVSQAPLATVIMFWTVQSLSSAPFQPFTSVPPPRPTPVLYCHMKLAVGVRVAAERG